MAIDPKLVSIIPASELPTGEPTSAGEFFFFEGNEMKKSPMTNIYDKVVGNFSGTLMISDTPTPSEPTWYFAGESGTYTNAGGLVVDLNGKLVVLNYDGTNWIKVEIDILIPLTSVLDPSNETEAVTGKAVSVFVDKKLDSVYDDADLLPFELFVGQITGATFGTSTNWIRTGRIEVKSDTFYTMEGYGTWPDAQVHRVNYYNGTSFISSEPSTGPRMVFKTPVGTTNIAIQIEAFSGIGSDIPNSPFWKTFRIAEGNDADLMVGIIAENIKGVIKTEQIKNIEEITDSVSPMLVTSFSSVPLVTTNGGLSILGEAIVLAGYLRTSTTSPSSMATVDDSKRYVYSGEINIGDNSSLVGVVYKDANLNFLGYEVRETGVFNRRELTLPAGTKYIATTSKTVTPVIEEKTVSLGGAESVIFVDTSYVGESDGSETKPYKTINEAIQAVNGGGKIIVGEGDYRETLALGTLSSGDYSFEVKRASKVRILGSEKLSGWVLTSGQTNTYEIPFTGTIPTGTRFGKILYEDGNPSRPILEEERHPLQKALSHRLPFTTITPKTSIAEVESNAATFYHDTVNGKLYLHPSNSTNPETNGFSYENAVRGFNTTPSAQTNKLINLSLSGLQFMYSTGGLRSIGFNRVFRENISVIGTTDAGCFRDDTSNIIAYNDEGAWCNGDGINGHFDSWGAYQSLTDNRSMQPVNIYYDPWMHDNWDDGISHHENHRYVIYGMLSEYNLDGGVRGSNDSNGTIYNGYSRKNGLSSEGSSGGEGFSVVNPTINVNRNGCKLVLFNCFAEGNNRGYSSVSDSLNQIELINCVSRNNAQAELHVGAGKLISRNTLASNADPNKLKVVSGGSIVIYNDSLVN